MAQKIVRYQYETSRENIEKLEKLLKGCCLRSKKDLLDNALTLFEWAVKEKRQGRIIASINENDQSIKEIIMPALNAIKN